MSTTCNQECPLCSGPAEYQLIDHENYKYFRCPHCTDFRISIGAEKRLARSISQWRTQLSEHARRGDHEKILTIYIPEPKPHEDGGAHLALKGDLKVRAALLW